MLTMALGSAACVKTTTIRSASTAVTPDVRPERIAGPYVPKGTRFAVRTVARIDSGTSHIDDAFEGLLVEPLRDNGGNIIANRGDHVIGRVSQVQSGRYPLIVLDFDGIRTSYGFRPLSVRVDDAQRVYYTGAEREILPPSGPYFGTAVYTPTMGRPFSMADGDLNGGITTPESYVGRPRNVRIEPGGLVTLQLTRPLVLR
jgi:hypothetical protein